jgi:tetratricopeptide (TPR) repeat protein
MAYPTYDTNSEDDIDALPNTYSAITLFLQTARRVNPSVKLTRENLVAVKEICQQVGGIPLGIELAAGWMEVLPAEKISLKIQENLDFLTAARRDLPDRHQSLRAVFSSTWEMLDDQLQEVFSKLTVFHGGFTHEAALDVAGASLNQLRTLLNKSLIQSLGDNRLEIHELLRQYGGEKLAQDEQHKIRVRDLHSRYFASYVEQNEEHTLFGNLESLRSEIDNILIGIRWAVKREFDHEITKQMMSMNTWFEQSGRREEGRDFFLWLKDRLNPDDRDKEKAIAYGFTLANLGWFTDSDREATAYFREARDILRRYHPGYELAVADAYLARLSGDVDYQEAEELFQESFTIFESLESAWGFAYTHNSWGDKALYDNHVPDAEIHYREGLKLSFDLGNVMKAWSLSGMGFVELFQGEYQKARKYLEEAYEAFNATDNKQWAAHRMNDLGDLALALGDLDEAERRHGEALEIRRRLGTQSFTAGSLCDLGRVALEKGDLLQAEAYFNKSIGAFADLGNRLEIGWVHRFLGDLATAMNDVRKASQEYRKSLTDIYEFRYEEYCLGVLTSIAGLWMKTSTGLQRAAELVYFVQNHPRTWIINQIALKRMIDELEDKLEAEALDNAAAAASSFELWSTVEQVIAELEASDEIKHSSANLRPDPHTSS